MLARNHQLNSLLPLQVLRLLASRGPDLARAGMMSANSALLNVLKLHGTCELEMEVQDEQATPPPKELLTVPEILMEGFAKNFGALLVSGLCWPCSLAKAL